MSKVRAEISPPFKRYEDQASRCKTKSPPFPYLECIDKGVHETVGLDQSLGGKNDKLCKVNHCTLEN